MIRDRLNRMMSAAGLLLLVLLTMNGSASAHWYRLHCKRGPHPSEGYAVPIQNVFQFPAAIVWQPGGELFPIVPFQNWTVSAPMGVSHPAFFLSYQGPHRDAFTPVGVASAPSSVRQAHVAPVLTRTLRQ
jgi:hypothetical protein